MKREIGEKAEGSNLKRHRPNPPMFENSSLNRKLSQLNADVKDGYVDCKISMKWPGRLQALSSDSSSSQLRFDIVFGESCAKVLERQNVDLVAGDHILLSLDGADIERRTATSSSSGITIRYSGKLAFKWVLCTTDGTLNGVIRDTEAGTEMEVSNEDNDWFQEQAVSQELMHAQQPSTSRATVEDPGAPKLSASQRRNLKKREFRKLQRAIEHAQKRQEQGVGVASSSTSIPLQTPAASKLERPSNVKQITSHQPEVQSIDVPMAPLQPVSTFDQAISDIESAFSGLRDGYLKVAQVNKTMNHIIIGVVTAPGKPQSTRSSDYSFAFRIIDQSVCKEDDGSLQHPRAFPVNCFSKNMSWLPQVEEGDVVILCHLKMSRREYQGVGYYDTLQWVVVDSVTGLPKEPNLNGGPSEVNAGFKTISPFHKPTPEELAYCRSLTVWWSEVQKKKKELQGNVHVVHDPNAETSIYTRTVADRGGSSKRRHLLLSEVTPDVEPSGYYDCTVEVVRSFVESNHHALYVTDYSGENEHLPDSHGPWAPTSMRKSLMRVELWDAAQPRGKSIKAGDILGFRNLRVRINTWGQVESKMKEDKISNLSGGENFTALLARKKKQPGQIESSTNDYTLVEELVDTKPASIFVQVVHVARSTHLMDLFVTDYTKHDKLASVEFPQPWAQRLQGKILKVKLAERQLILASDLEAGSFCTLRDLLVRTFATDNNIFQGRLGGSGTCVIPHKGPQHMSAETRKMYDDLVERRDNAQSTVRNPEDQKPQSSTEHRKPESGTKDVKPSETLTKHAAKSHESLSEIPVPKRETPPGHIVLTGQAVGVAPENVGQCCLMRCSECGEVVNASGRFKRCEDGPGFRHYQYRLAIKMKDKNGRIHPIDVENQWTGFENLRKVNLKTSGKGADEFLAAIRPLVGNWRDGSPEVNGPMKEWLVEPKRTRKRDMLCLVEAWDQPQ